MSELKKMTMVTTNAGFQTPKEKCPPESQVTRAKIVSPATAFGCPRDFLGNRFIYVTVSARARGLSVGVNMNPDKQCNFDCVYCEVNRCLPIQKQPLDVAAMGEELQRTLAFVNS